MENANLEKKNNIAYVPIDRPKVLNALLEATLFGLGPATEDKNEGTTAFLEKRAPNFQGKWIPPPYNQAHMPELVMLWRYRDLPEALVAKSKLESAALWCFLADENIVRLNWFLANAVGGLRLQVSDEDAEDALALLREEIPARFSAEETGEEYWQPACPTCGSRDVTFELFSKAVALVFLAFTTLPVWIPKKVWKGDDCSHEWKAEYD